MFRKLTTIVGLCLLVACVWFLYQVNEEQKGYRAKVDEFHTKVAIYSDQAKGEANLLATKLASPYYVEWDGNTDRLTERVHVGATPIDHVDIISIVTYNQANLRYASFDEQHAYLMVNTPAPILFDFHSALNELSKVRSMVRWRNFDSLAEAQKQFVEAKKAMNEALREARAYDDI